MNDNLFSALDKSVLPPSIGPISELVYLAGSAKVLHYRPKSSKIVLPGVLGDHASELQTARFAKRTIQGRETAQLSRKREP